MSRTTQHHGALRQDRCPLFRIIAATTVIAVTLLTSSVEARQPSMIRLKRIIKIDDLGNGKIDLQIKASTKQYTQIKARTPNVALLLRRLGAGQHWSLMKDIQGKFNDSTSTIEISYKHINLARLTSATKWQLRFEDDADVDLVAIMGTTAIFTSTEVTDLGLIRLIIEIHAPKGSKNVKLLKGPGRIEYDHAPVVKETGAVRANLELKVKPKIMTALAKLYGNPKFSFLWTARSCFTNTGDCTIRDFRVRFRVAQFSSWSGWKRVKRVLPKQQIVDVFFPVLDLEKMTKLTGTRPAVVEIEYRYRDSDGKLVEESDTRRVEVLSRNEVLFSSFGQGEAVGFYDQFNLTPAVLASMVSTNDPIMQQVAGGVSKMAGGGAASTSDEAALKYMKALYDFMSNNRISYQTPPNYLADGRFGQHIKYGRDVLRNRAGTCVDLAIFYASACEAVGLRSTLMLIPGHCYPGVILPGGRHVAVESTMIGRYSFLDAFKNGCKKLPKAVNGLSYVVKISEMRSLGVHSLDLAAPKTTFLQDLGYKFTTTSTTSTNNRNNNQTRPQPKQGSIPQNMVGKWLFKGTINGKSLVAVFQLTASGQYASILRISDGYNVTEEKETGRVQVRGNMLHIYPKGDTPVQRKFWFKNGLLWVNFAEIKYNLGFTKVQ